MNYQQLAPEDPVLPNSAPGGRREPPGGGGRVPLPRRTGNGGAAGPMEEQSRRGELSFA